MIMNKLVNLEKYVPPCYIAGIKNFLEKIHPEMEEKVYEIYKSQVYAKVMSYDTKEKNLCEIEAHNRYIDIQSTIIGAEGIEIYQRNSLLEKISYNDIDDVAFYSENDTLPYAVNTNIPGYFSMIGPEEAHRPQIRVMGYEKFVKKFVIKMEVSHE